MSADVIEIFGARTTPEACTQRPALFHARMAWARMRLAAASACSIGGISEGERVRVMVAPGTWRTGVLQHWSRGGQDGARVLATQTVGRILLDPGQDAFRNGFRVQTDGMVTAPRFRIGPAV